MARYMTLDAAGRPSFFDDQWTPQRPDGAVTVTQAQVDHYMARQPYCHWDQNAMNWVDDPVPPAPAMRRAASLSALLDPLSPAQRASITADHKDRLQAEASEHPGGLLPIGNAKIIRAAVDLGLTPDAWFALAGY